MSFAGGFAAGVVGEGDAADGGLGFFFDFGFVFFAGGEVAFHEAAFGDEFFEFVVSGGGFDAGVAEGFGFFEHGGLDGVELGAGAIGD